MHKPSLGLVGILWASIAPAQAGHAALTARLDSLVTARLGATPSIAVAVLRGRDTLLLKGYGLADREANSRATPNTIYEIGSLTKHITASAIARLAEQGRLGFDDEISRYVRFPIRGYHVTVRQLLNHTSGIPNYTAGQAWRAHWAEDLKPDSIVGFVAGQPFDFAPGNGMRYSNTGYILLGMIIEKVSGRRFADFVRDEFFTPLGLRHTGYCVNHPTDSLVAKGYSWMGAHLAPTTYLSMSIPFAAGAICSSVSDYAAFERAFHENRVVSEASYRVMTEADTVSAGTAYLFGLAMGRLAGHPAHTHGGGINGFATAQVYLPRDSVTVVVFTNWDEDRPEPLAFDLARLVIGVTPNGFGALDRR